LGRCGTRKKVRGREPGKEERKKKKKYMGETRSFDLKKKNEKTRPGKGKGRTEDEKTQKRRSKIQKKHRPTLIRARISSKSVLTDKPRGEEYRRISEKWVERPRLLTARPTHKKEKNRCPVKCGGKKQGESTATLVCPGQRRRTFPGGARRKKRNQANHLNQTDTKQSPKEKRGRRRRV